MKLWNYNKKWIKFYLKKLQIKLLFIDKFSKTYRYVLDSNSVIIVPLKDEIDFIHSFIYLNNLRFGENLKVTIHVSDEALDQYILPLSLQFLVENAIKHNEVTAEHPLEIKIEANEGWLVVSNNLQLKKQLESSTGMGLKNITEQYIHFSDVIPTFGVENNLFVARLPLLENWCGMWIRLGLCQ